MPRMWTELPEVEWRSQRGAAGRYDSLLEMAFWGGRMRFDPGFQLVGAATRGKSPARAIRLGILVAHADADLRSLMAMQKALVGATDPQSGIGSAPHVAQLGARLRSWIADQLLGTLHPSSTPALGIHRTRTVEEWIDAHLAEPITLGRLCAVAGVGERHLESTFRAYRGETPLQFVLGRRLAWVRRSLLDSSSGDPVTQLAHDAGFSHLGRFAARYRHAYRESPSATLRRSLKRY